MIMPHPGHLLLCLLSLVHMTLVRRAKTGSTPLAPPSASLPGLTPSPSHPRGQCKRQATTGNGDRGPHPHLNGASRSCHSSIPSPGIRPALHRRVRPWGKPPSRVVDTTNIYRAAAASHRGQGPDALGTPDLLSRGLGLAFSCRMASLLCCRVAVRLRHACSRHSTARRGQTNFWLALSLSVRGNGLGPSLQAHASVRLSSALWWRRHGAL